MGPSGWITKPSQVLIGPNRLFFQLRGVRKAHNVGRRAQVSTEAATASSGTTGGAGVSLRPRWRKGGSSAGVVEGGEEGSTSVGL